MIKVSSKTRLVGRGVAGLRQRILATLLGFSMTVASAVGQTQQQDEEQAEKTSQIALNLRDVDVRVLINTVAEVTGRTFIVDPRVKGKVSVISGAPLNAEQLYDVFLSILEVHNYATVDSDTVIKVLPSNVIKQRPTPTLFSPTEDFNDEQITQIIQLDHASVQDLVPIIRPLIPPTSHFAPHNPSNSVVITDTAANIQRVLKIIRKIDIPDKSSSIHMVNLDHAKASDLATTLTQLITATTDPKEAASSPKVSIQAYDSTNSLIVSASSEQFARIQALIDELDVERDIAGDVNVITLKHSSAEDLASILKDLVATGAQGSGPSEFSVQADEASNSLIVKASSTQLRTVQDVVEKLDKRRAQVFVETIIAEVSLTQQADLGVTWGAGVDAPSTPGADGGAAVVDTRANTVFDRAGTGQVRQTFNLPTAGFNYNLFDFGRYQLDVIVNALRSDSNSNVLSTPTILTLDNEEAEIIVGQEVPFVTGRFNNGFNNSTSTDSDGNTTVSSGNSFQTIERKDVGIKLKIKPQINDGDTIQLEVFQETSNVSEQTVEGQADLITNRRSIETVVQMDDGQVVALGGLITDDLVDTVEWVPFLGKIPVLGALFRNKSKTAVKRNLMVFLKPRIIRSPEDLAKYSRSRYDEVRNDGLVTRNNTDDFLIKDSEPPVLVNYDDAVEDEIVGSEVRQYRRENGTPKRAKRSRIKDIIFGRKRPQEDEPEAQDDVIESEPLEQTTEPVYESDERQQEDGFGVFPEAEEGQE